MSIAVPSSLNPSCINSNFSLHIFEDAASELIAKPAQVGQWKIPLRENTDFPLSAGDISTVPSLGHNILSFTNTVE
jgi:hypothetical protein